MTPLPINKIIIHCSASPENMDIGAEEIHDWHLKRGFDGIGYHYVIRRNGMCEVGRPEYWVGAHVKGNNVNSLGICLVGNTEFTNKQWNTLESTVIGLLNKYPDAKVLGHYELDDKKTCPNFNVQAWINGILSIGD